MRQTKTGDYVEIATSEDAVKGILLESPELEKDTVIIKLDSGYNIGINRKKIKKISLLPQPKAKEAKEKKEAKQGIGASGKLPKISILHTGGTIASKVDYKTGAVTAKFSSEELMQLFPELTSIANISSRQILSMQSEMARFPHYNIIAREIEKEIGKGAEGIIVTHGTDTMHYSSAALAFMLENLPVPVIFVGSQRSSDRGSTDAALNFISAAYFITNSDFAEVAICMHENLSDNDCLILPATKTRKMHTSRRDTFRPINASAIARVNYEEKKISFLKKDYCKKSRKKLQLRPINEKLKIGILKSHVNMFASEVDAYHGFDGLVLEGTGLGHMPNEKVDEFTAENLRIQKAIAQLIQNGTVVVMAPQTIYGRLQLDVYTPQRELQEIGVLGHLSDMTPETTFIKLAWLLSNYKKDEVKKLITQNLRGEISDRTEEGNFLI